MNTAVWICDEFMEAITKEEREWYLFDPAECPELHETCMGKILAKKYDKSIAKWLAMPRELKSLQENSQLRNSGKKCLTGVVSKLGILGSPSKIPSNIRYSNKHVGVVH